MKKNYSDSISGKCNFWKSKFLRKMRIVVILLFIGITQTLAVGSYAQTKQLSLNCRNQTILKIINQIEDQSEFYFMYDATLVDVNQRKTINCENQRIIDILDELLEGTEIAYEISNRQIVLTHSNESDQQKTLSGKVTDISGVALPGVTVAIKGSTHGTVTNADGEYYLSSLKDGDVIVFSFIGMSTQEITYSGQSSLDVKMDTSTQDINEVVVTALGLKREIKKIGYAVTEVEGEEIAKLNTVNPVQALQGKAAGVSIGSSDGGLFGSTKIQVRGVSVLNSSNNQPIFVVDGVIIENEVNASSADWSTNSDDYGNQLKNLNPDDYESITVLKGAAATALYGSRGINGAVVIKTKDGKGSRGIGVNVTQSFGVDHVFAQPDIQYTYGPGALAGYTDYGEQDANGNYYRYSTNQFYTNSDGVATKISHPWGDMGFGPKFDGREIIDWDGSVTTYSPVKDHMLKMYDLGYNSNTSVSVSGGNEKGSFYMSDSYNYRKGNLPNNEFSRNSFKLAATYNLTDWLHADGSITFVSSNPRNASNNIQERIIYGDFMNWYDADKWNKRSVWQAPHGGTPNSNYGDQYANVPGNSTWFNYNMNNQERMEQISRPIASLTADITKWLSVKAEASMNHYTYRFEKKELGSGYANDGGRYELNHYRDVSKTGKLTATINYDLSEDITSSLLVGGEIWTQEKSYSNANTEGGLIVPGQFYLDNSKDRKNCSARVFGTKKINSMYYMASLGWRDQVFVDITGRNDWSSTLVYSDGTGNNSYFYPSISASWLLTESLAVPSWFSFGKLRASWAQVGNDTDAYTLNKGYSINRTELRDGSNVYSNSINTTAVDKDIKPERKNSFEVGTDLRFIENRIGFDVAYYNEKIKNQIGSIGTPRESGQSNYLTNIGSMRNRGIELTIMGTPVKTSDFEWNLTFNYWKNKTKLLSMHEYYGAFKNLSGDVSYGNFRIGSVAYEGGEYGVLMSDSAPLKDDQGRKILTWRDDYRGAFYTRSGEEEVVGKLQPDFEGSLMTEFKYKNLSLSASFDARFGGHVASFPSRYGTAWGVLETSTQYRDKEHGGIEWTSAYGDTQGQTFEDGMIPDGVFAQGQTITAPSGETVNVGGMTYQEAYEAGYVEPTHASFNTYYNSSWSLGVVNDNWFTELEYIALRNISVGYTLPKTIARKINAQSVYVALNARNLGYLHNTMPNNMNPEAFRATTSSEGFRQRTMLPYTATYTFTLSVDF